MANPDVRPSKSFRMFYVSVPAAGIGIVGYFSRAAILRARRERIEQEHAREPGWLKCWRPG